MSSTVAGLQRFTPAAVGRRVFSSLRRRNYRLWFFGQTVSQSGSWMQAVAQSSLVLWRLHGSAVDLGITSALQFGPVLFLGPIGGLLADRFDKRKILLATQSAFMAQALILGVLVATGSVRLWMVWALALGMGVINSADNPARQSFVAEMVGPADLPNAIGLNSVIVNASRIAGPAVAGILIVTVGMSWTFMLNAASFGAVLAALLAMRAADLYRRPPMARAKGQIRAGLRYAVSTWQLLLPLAMMAVIGIAAYNFSVVLPLFADLFGRGAGTYGLMATAMGVGALGGALSAAARRRPTYRLLTGVTFAFGAVLVAVSFAPTLPLMLLLLVPMGATSVLFIATANSLLQLYASDAMRGRVMALWAMVFLGSTPIGGPLTGLVAAWAGVRVALALGAVATLLTAAGAAVALRRVGRGEHEPDVPAADAGAALAEPAAALRCEGTAPSRA